MFVKHQYLAINLRTGPDTDESGIVISLVTSPASFAGIFSSTMAKQPDLASARASSFEPVSLILLRGSYCVGSEFMDRLGCQAQVTHNRNPGGENPFHRFANLPPPFELDCRLPRSPS